jgi:hypothetical protein
MHNPRIGNRQSQRFTQTQQTGRQRKGPNTSPQDERRARGFRQLPYRLKRDCRATLPRKGCHQRVNVGSIPNPPLRHHRQFIL